MRTDNDFMLAGNSESISPLLVLNITTQEQAYRTAAWIEAMAVVLPHEEEEGTYEEIREAIRNT